jgi:hypothetical protein
MTAPPKHVSDKPWQPKDSTWSIVRYIPSKQEREGLRDLNCTWSNLRLGPQHYRLIFWMIDAGMHRNETYFGWVNVCARMMHTTPVTVAHRVATLVKEGALLRVGKARIKFNPDFFASVILHIIGAKFRPCKLNMS